MRIINYINPFSKNHHALSEFATLNAFQKFTVIFTSTLVSMITLFIAMTPVFRALVHKFTKINLLHASETIKKTYKIKEKIISSDLSKKKTITPLEISILSSSTSPIEKKKNLSLLLKDNNPLAIIPYQSRPHINLNKRFIYSINSNERFFLDKLMKNQGIRKEPLALMPLSHNSTEILNDEPRDSLDDISKLNRVIPYSAQNVGDSLLLTESLLDFQAISRGKILAEVRDDLHYKGSYNLLGKFSSLFGLNLNDQIVISIDINGEIFIGKELANQVNLFFEMIQSTYGRVLGQLIINRYFRNHRGETILTKVTYGDYKKVLTGAAANVKVENLQALFALIKKDDPSSIDYLCKDLLNADEIDKLKSFNHFNELSSNEINLLYSCYSNFCNPEGAYFSVFHDLIKHCNIQPSPLKFDYFSHDVYLLDVINQFIHLDLKDLPLSISEHLSKKLAYNELKPGMIIPLFNSESKLCFYHVANQLQYKNDGVAAFLIAPMNTNNHFNKNATDIFLVFRGTCPMPSQEGCAKSWLRDLEFRGIGKTSFLKRSDEIKLMVENYLLNSDSNINLHISGHSLGGCDVQRALLLVMKNIDKEDGGLWSKVNKIIVKTHNAPRVEVKTIEKFIEIHNSLERKNKNLQIELTHVRFKDRENDDIVQWYGEMLVGAKIESSKILKINVIFITMDASFGPLGIVERHGSAVFSSPNKAPILNIERFDENNNKELQKILMQNHFWNEGETITEMMAQFVSWHLSPAYTVPRNVFHFFLSNTILTPLVQASQTIILNRNRANDPFFIK